MENGALLAMNLNETVGIGPFNSPPPSFPQEESENLPIGNTDTENDVVELSRESLQISRENAAVNPPVELEENLLETAVATEEEFPVEAPDRFLNAGMEDTLETETNPVGIPGGDETNLVVETETIAAGVTAPTENTPLTVGNEETEPTPLPTQPLEGEIATELELERAAAETPPPETPVAPLTAEGTVVREPEARPETAIPEETTTPLETQADELARSNEALSRTNQFVVGPTPANESSDVSPETPRNEQQVLLQNVGSQLAQVIPPASVISVLG